MTTLNTHWYPDKHLVVTELHGIVTSDDVKRWSNSLENTLAVLADGQDFKLVVNMIGYQYENLTAHKDMRVVIPRLLSQHGFRSCLFDIAQASYQEIISIRGVTCIAIAHVHHDKQKMNLYEGRFRLQSERFFSDFDKAIEWIMTVPVFSS